MVMVVVVLVVSVLAAYVVHEPVLGQPSGSMKQSTKLLLVIWLSVSCVAFEPHVADARVGFSLWATRLVFIHRACQISQPAKLVKLRGSHKLWNKLMHALHGNGPGTRITGKRKRPESEAAEPLISAVVSWARVRWCIVCNAIKHDGPRHKHDTGHEVRALTDIERDAVAPTAKAKARAATATVYDYNFGKYNNKTVAAAQREDPAYFTWILREGLHLQRADLQAAMRAAGLLAAEAATSSAGPSCPDAIEVLLEVAVAYGDMATDVDAAAELWTEAEAQKKEARALAKAA